jgi:broad specificity phosphatase PhoE
MKRLILVRHGQTTPDKTNLNRGLSPHGIIQVKALSLRLQLLIIKPTIIIHSPTQRAKQTAQIIAKQLSIRTKTANLRLKNVGNLQPGNIRPAQAYLSLNQYGNIESPPELVNRWLKIFNSINHTTIIAISHEASLEAFFYHQTALKLEHKSFRKFFSYADFALLVI